MPLVLGRRRPRAEGLAYERRPAAGPARSREAALLWQIPWRSDGCRCIDHAHQGERAVGAAYDTDRLVHALRALRRSAGWLRDAAGGWQRRVDRIRRR